MKKLRYIYRICHDAPGDWSVQWGEQVEYAVFWHTLFLATWRWEARLWLRSYLAKRRKKEAFKSACEYYDEQGVKAQWP